MNARSAVPLPVLVAAFLLAAPAADAAAQAAPGAPAPPAPVSAPEAATAPEAPDGPPSVTALPTPGAPEPVAPAAPDGQHPEAAAVEAVVRDLFDAMRAADSAAARELFHPEARLSGPAEKDGEVVLRTSPVQPFLDAMGGADPGEWDERIGDVEVRVDGALATAWMRYAFHHAGELSHCGVNAVQLYRSAEGWKIFQVADTRRTEGCPELEASEG